MRKKLSGRVLSLIMAVVFLIGVLPAAAAPAAGTPADLAVWSFVQGGSTTTATLPQTAVSGVFTGSSFSHYAQTGVNYTASNKSVYINGWDNADSTAKYWQIVTYSAGYENLSIKFNAWGSGTGPKNFDLLYSTDGVSFAKAASYALTDTANTAYTFNLPAEAADAASLTLRFQVNGTTAINGTVTASGGTSRMAEISITGTSTGTTDPDPDPDPTWTFDGESGTVVSVTYSNAGGNVLMTAMGGDYASVSDMSFIKNGAPVTLNFSSGGANLSGLSGCAGNAYWLIKTSSKSFANLKLSGAMRSSGTGPRDFTVQYSADGSAWKDFPNSAAQAGNTVHASFDVTLPDGAANLDTLYIRILMSSEIAVNSGAVGSGGTHQINNIVLTGDYILADGQVAPVTPSVPSGEIPLGTAVTLSSATEGAQTLVSYDGASYSPASSIVIDAAKLGAPIYVKATKAGMTDSRVRTLVYTQAKVKPVKPASSDFDVAPGTKVTLTCETPGATIYYALGDAPQPGDFTVYTAPITLTELPASVTAYATAPGCIDGDPVKYTYRKGMSVGEYNIYFGQLHSHTELSDGSGSLDQAFSYAKNTARQIDFLAITDHSNSFDNTGSYNINGKKAEIDPASSEWEAGQAAADAYTDSTFVGIYGYEMTWSASTGGFGHMNTFNTKGFESRNDSYFTSNTAAKETNGLYRYFERLTTASGSLSQFNHPGSTFGDFLDFAFYDPKFDDYVNLIEVGNGEEAIGAGKYFRSYEYYTRALDRGWHVAPSNNQDNHFGKWGDANTGRTVVLAQSLTRDDIYAAIAARRVYATEDDNLGIRYSLDGHPMGYIYPDGAAPEGSVSLHVELTDPDNVIAGSKISIIVNYGQEAVTRTVSNDPAGGAVLTKDASGTTFTWDVELPATYAYYYVLVTEPNGIMAVTAPVWLGKVENMGIKKTSTTTVMPVKGEPLPVKTTFYNEESSPLKISRISYSIGGENILTYDFADLTLNKGETYAYEFMFTPAKLGSHSIDVTLYAEYNGEARVYRDVLKLKVADPDNLVTIAIDASHYNAYVAGSYAFSYNNFLTLCASVDIRVKVISEITAAALADCAAVVITPPATRAGTYTPRDGSPAINYTAQAYSQAELDVLAAFAAAGGSFLICGVADYNDTKPDYPKSSPYHASTQINAVLAAIGATTRQGDNEVVDFDNQVNESYRLAFKESQHNAASKYTDGVKASQTYSFYSGCSVSIDTAKAEWIVRGFDTTFAIDADGDTNGTAISASTRPTNMNDPRIDPKPGQVVALAAEQLPGGGTAFVGGTVFFSDFEIPDFDASNSLQNSNMMVVWNMLKTLRKELPVTPIGTARTYELGKKVTVEGIAMTYSSGENPELAFFDCIYVQDETGGICVFGITNDIKIKAGQKVRVTGSIHEYLGDLELVISSPEDVEVIVESAYPLDFYARYFKPAQVMDPSNNGWYCDISGVVTRVEKDDTGKIKAFWIKQDPRFINPWETLDPTEARILIDGYIGYSNTNREILEDFVIPGNNVRAFGFVSTDPDGQRLRVANRSVVYHSQFITSLSVGPKSIVEGLPANLQISVSGYNLEKESLYIIFENDQGYKSERYPIVLGDQRVYIKAAPPAGEYSVRFCRDIGNENYDYALGFSSGYTILPYEPDKLWTPVKVNVGGLLGIHFYAPISFAAGKMQVTVDGKPVNAALAYDGQTIITDVRISDIDPESCAVVAKGIVYPQHFPSYAFTFTVKNFAGDFTLPQPPDNRLWTPFALAVDGYIAVRFFEPIASATPGMWNVEIDGVPVGARLAEDGVTLVTDMKVDDIGSVSVVIVLKGIKYPRLYPNYSFTFTVRGYFP